MIGRYLTLYIRQRKGIETSHQGGVEGVGEGAKVETRVEVRVGVEGVEKARGRVTVPSPPPPPPHHHHHHQVHVMTINSSVMMICQKSQR